MRTERKKEGRDNSFPSFNNHAIGNCIIQRYDYIPLDFIKTQVIGLSREHFLSNKNLLFTPVLIDGDLIKYQWCEIDNIKVKVYQNSIFLQGSLHKFYNGGEHNYNDFNLTAFRDVLRRLFELFNVTPENLNLTCIEYGVNIFPPIESNKIINHLFQHKRKEFESKISNDKGNYRQAEHNEYIVKIYNKAKQFRLNYEVLRIEIKETNLRHHRTRGIFTLNDFIESDKTTFITSLIDKWNEVIYYDCTNENTDNWNKYNNVNYWRDIEKNLSSKNYNKHRLRLKEINEKFGQNIQGKVSNLILSKINELQRVTFSRFIENPKFCRITGIDISMQKNSSFLLSHTGIYYLSKHKKTEFERIKRKYLLKHWRNKSIEFQVKEIAHNIRNKYNYRMKSINVNQLSFFNW